MPNLTIPFRLFKGFILVPVLALSIGITPDALAQAASIAGTVSDTSGNPVRGARVYIEQGLDGPVEATTSDTQGAFAFDTVLPGTVGVFARAPGYGFNGTNLTLSTGERADAIEIRLSAAGRIEGTVRNSEGETVRGARFTRAALLGSDPVGIPFAKLVREGLPEPRSGANGAFAIDSLPEGASVALKVAHPDYAQAGVLGITVGDKDVRVALRPGVLITGKVEQRDSDLAIAHTPVFFTNADPPHDTVITQSLSDGSYAVRLNPGSWFVRAAGPSFRTTALRGFDIREGMERQVLNIDVAPTAKVRGAVKDARTGDPIEDARLSMETLGTLSALARTGPDGQYSFEATEGEVVVRLGSVPGYLSPPDPALRVIVDAGHTVELPTFWAAPIPPYSVEVIDRGDAAVADAIITLFRPRQFGWRVANADGIANLTVASLPADGTVVGAAYHASGEAGAVFAIPRNRSEDAIVQVAPLTSISGKIIDDKERGAEGIIVECRAVLPGLPEPVVLWQTLSDGSGEYTWPAAAPRVPQMIAAIDPTGTTELSRSEIILPESPGPTRLPPLAVDGSIKAESLRGSRVDWWKGSVLCGLTPNREQRSTSIKVVVVSPAENVRFMVDGLAEVQRVIDDSHLLTVVLTEGTPECGDADVSVIQREALGSATVYVLDEDDRVVLETFDLPPPPYLNRLLGELNE